MMGDVQSKEISSVEVPLKKGTWSSEEDQSLIAYINRYGIWNWNKMPKPAGLLRSGKSCRLRWMNYLRPDIKRGNFSKEEDETILTLHEMLGNRWSAIAAKMPGRTDNEIKNRWHSHLRKHFNDKNYGSQAESINQKNYNSDKNDVSSLLFSTTAINVSNSSESSSMGNTPITSSSSSDFSLSHFSSSSSTNFEDIQSFSVEDLRLIQDNELMDIDQMRVHEKNMEVRYAMEVDNWATTTYPMGPEIDGSVYAYSYTSNIHEPENDDFFQYYPLW